MPTGVAKTQVIPRLGEFLAAHPQIELELSSTDRRVDLVREGFDCVVRVGPLGDSALVARQLGVFRQLNVASPAYLAAHGTPRTLADLAHHRIVHYVGTLGSKPVGFEHVTAQGVHTVPMAGALLVNSAESYQAACLAGLGIVQAPQAGLLQLLREGSLVEVLPQHQAPPLPVSLLYAHRRHLPKRVQVFMAWIGEVLQPLLEPAASVA